MVRPLSPIFVVLLTSTAVYGQGGGSSSNRAKEHFINGTALQMQGGKDAEAILEFQQALRTDSSAATLLAISRSYVELRRLSLAEENCRAALKLDSTSAPAWELLAEILIAGGKYDDGIVAYENLLKLNPNPRQLYTLGRLYEPRNARKAIEIFTRLAQQDPSADLYLRIAELNTRLRDKEGWLNALKNAVATDETNLEAASNLTQAYAEFGMLDQSFLIARRWQQLYPRSDATVTVWAAMLQSLLADSLLANLYADSVNVFLIECENQFTWSSYISTLAGAVALEVNNLRSAANLFDAAANKVSNQPDQLLQIAALYISNDRPADAIRFLEKWQPRRITDPRFNLVAADCFLRMNKDHEAEAEYRAALMIDSTIVEAWLQIALINDNDTQFQRAIVAYERALDLDPENAVANNNYAYTLVVRGGDLSRAKDMAIRAVQQSPMNPAYLDTYAWVLYKSGDYERALIYIKQAIEHGGNATHYEHMGDILESLGDSDGAVNAWMSAIEKDSDRNYLRSKIDKYR